MKVRELVTELVIKDPMAKLWKILEDRCNIRLTELKRLWNLDSGYYDIFGEIIFGLSTI